MYAEELRRQLDRCLTEIDRLEMSLDQKSSTWKESFDLQHEKLVIAENDLKKAENVIKTLNTDLQALKKVSDSYESNYKASCSRLDAVLQSRSYRILRTSAQAVKRPGKATLLWPIRVVKILFCSDRKAAK